MCRLPFNLGVGGAMRTGFRYAERHGYDVLVQVDADGQHDPVYLPTLVKALDSANVVVGARFAGEGGCVVRGPRHVAMHASAATGVLRFGVGRRRLPCSPTTHRVHEPIEFSQ